MKRELKGGLPAWEMGDEVLGSIPSASSLNPSASPWVHTVALTTHKTGDEGWPPNSGNGR